MDVPTPNVDRRPIAVRSWPVFGSMATTLVRLGVSANTVSLAGMAAALAAGAALAATSWKENWTPALLLLAAALIPLRLLANLLDGLVAVEGNQRTPVGELYNEVPDRIADAAVLIGAGYAIGSSPALGWLAALLAVFVAYVRAIGKGAGLPSDFRGPMAKQQRMVIIVLACLYAALAPDPWQPILPAWLGGPRPGAFAAALAVISLGSAVTAIRRLNAIAYALRARAAKEQAPDIARTSPQ